MLFNHSRDPIYMQPMPYMGPRNRPIRFEVCVRDTWRGHKPVQVLEGAVLTSYLPFFI